MKSGALLENAPDVPFPGEDSNDFERRCLWPVNNGVVGITTQCPETEGTRREVRPGVAALRRHFVFIA